MGAFSAVTPLFKRLNEWLSSGANWHWIGLSTIWLSGLLILAFLTLISWYGLRAFWPPQLEEWLITDGGRTETVIAERVAERVQQVTIDSEPFRQRQKQVLLFRQQLQARQVIWEYRWYTEAQAARITTPVSLVKVHLNDGRVLAGYPVAIANQVIPIMPTRLGVSEDFQRWLDKSPESDESTGDLVLALHDGSLYNLPRHEIRSISKPNTARLTERIGMTLRGFFWFMSHGEDLQQGTGILPAIIGTLLLVILMTIFLTPLGVLTAVYLHEYREKRWLTRVLHIAVSNLAGVPGIVFGVFVLGFFVHGIGGGLDTLLFGSDTQQRFFANNSLLWAALALALLNVPVVVIATVEGLSRIPDELRYGALALGATRAEMIWGVVVQAARPAVLTGLILAVARAAGEVAPLLLIGVVGFSGEPLIDSGFPFLHVERPFMHLGYQVYDFAIQSGNPHAAVPRAYATTLALLALVVLLNLTAIRLRSNLQKNYHSQEI